MILITLLFLLELPAYPLQSEIQVTRLEDPDLVSLINSIETELRYPTNEFAVSLFKKANPSGSANTPGTDEISHSYLIGISEFDEDPRQSLFLVGEFLSPNITDKKISRDQVLIEVEYGDATVRKKCRLKISLHDVKVQ